MSVYELKRCAYCKWHNSFSHATNDCNVFHRHVQLTINEDRLNFQEMQVDTQPFPINTIYLANNNSSLGRRWPIKTKEKASSSVTLRSSMRIGKSSLGRLLLRRDGGKTLKITIKSTYTGGECW
jgi:hypothetical protein